MRPQHDVALQARTLSQIGDSMSARDCMSPTNVARFWGLALDSNVRRAWLVAQARALLYLVRVLYQS